MHNAWPPPHHHAICLACFCSAVGTHTRTHLGYAPPPSLFFAASAVLIVLRYWLRCEHVERVFKSNVFGVNAQENARQRAI